MTENIHQNQPEPRVVSLNYMSCQPKSPKTKNIFNLHTCLIQMKVCFQSYRSPHLYFNTLRDFATTAEIKSANLKLCSDIILYVSDSGSTYASVMLQCNRDDTIKVCDSSGSWQLRGHSKWHYPVIMTCGQSGRC